MARRRVIAGVAGAAAVLTASLAVAQPSGDSPPFPLTRRPADVSAWLRRYTNVNLADVVVIGKEFLFAIDPAVHRLDASTLQLSVREEVLTPDVAARIRARSAFMVMSVRCADRTFLINTLSFYDQPNMAGLKEPMSPSKAWVTAPPGDYVADVLSSACDPAYRRPFAPVIANLPAPPHPQASASPVADARLAGTIVHAPPLAPPPPVAPPAQPSAAAISGGYLAQLGAFRSADLARAALDAVPEPERDEQSRRVIDPTPVKGVILYRAQLTGFASAAAAEAFCSRVRAQGLACLTKPQTAASPAARAP